MNSELEENRELADNRFIELQKLQQDLQSVQQENNNMKVCFYWTQQCFGSRVVHQNNGCAEIQERHTSSTTQLCAKVHFHPKMFVGNFASPLKKLTCSAQHISERRLCKTMHFFSTVTFMLVHNLIKKATTLTFFKKRRLLVLNLICFWKYALFKGC